jgi:anti-sigma B factor antagonist
MTLVVDVESLTGERAVVRVAGEIDAYTAPQFREQLGEAEQRGPRGVVVDLRKVRYLDSTGLGVMIGGAKRARERGARLVLICTNEHVLRILRISGLSELLPVVAEESEALEALSAGGRPESDE